MTDVVSTEEVLGGEPRIAGTRIGVLDVYELVVDGECSPADVADQLGCSLADVYAALAYYYDNPDEMRNLRQERERTMDSLSEDTLQPPEPAR